MPILKLIRRNIEALPAPPRGQVIYRDSDLPGLGLLVGTKSKSFFVEGQVDRRNVRKSLGRYGPITPERARALALRALSEMAENRHPAGERRAIRARTITVGEAFSAFFAGRPNLSPRTVGDYGRSVTIYLADWQPRPIAEITREMILDRHRRVAEQHGPVTANNVMRHLRSVYNYTSATAGELPANPVRILTQSRSWNPERRRRTVIPLHGLARWYKAVMAEDESARDFLRVALLTGMRRTEIGTLRWENIGFDSRVLTVPRTKNGEPLVLPLSTPLYDLLLSRRDNNPEGEWVFPGRGVTGHLVEMKSFVARVGKASGVRFSCHDLRRTFATISEGLDLPAYCLKAMLNHSCGTDITGSYIVVHVERLRQPVERVAAHIMALVAPESLREAA